MSQHSQLLADADGVQVRVESDVARLTRAAELLDAAERQTGSPLVDEAERERLGRAVQGEPSVDAAGWRPALAWRGDQMVGYVAVVADDVRPRGDAAVLTVGHDDVAVLRVLLAAARQLATGLEVSSLQVWTRRAGEPQIEAARQVGFDVDRRLGVLGRALGATLGAAPVTAATIRAFRPGLDDADVVDVLAAAYAGTDEAGWDRDGFAARTQLDWFRPGDLLVAERAASADGPRLGGLHWLKRRDATTGEVYNLAVHPAAQGEGLGPALLHAGLAHLRDQGLRDVILWVDLANERAVRLYQGQGFETRWLDLALEASVDGRG